MGSLEDLAAVRDELLKAEVAAWLHDMKKCSEKHIMRQMEPPQNIVSQNSNPIDASKALDQIKSFDVNLLGESMRFDDLFEEGRPRNITDQNRKWLARVLGRCHSAAHTEKEEVFYLLKQVKDTRRSSPFGYESAPLRDLAVRLTNLPFNKLFDPSFGEEVEKVFSTAVGETRRPLNDVTLWDWSSMVAALYKAALAEAVLIGKGDPSQIQWRLLSIRFNGLDFFAKAHRIPDLLARQKLLINGLDNVRKLLEERYPLGSEIYRDENGSVFIVPNISNLCRLKNQQGKELSDLIREEFGSATLENQISLKIQGEVILSLALDSQGWEWNNLRNHNSPMPIAEHINQNLPLQSDRSIVSGWWRKYSEDICSVCQLRPQGWGANDYETHYSYQVRGKKCPDKPICQTCKALERKVCAICEQRREKRAKQWARKTQGINNGSSILSDEGNYTIWLDEVADVHGQLALIVGMFDLRPWLKGKMLFYPESYDERNQNNNHVMGFDLRLRNPNSYLTTSHSIKYLEIEIVNPKDQQQNVYRFALDHQPTNLSARTKHTIWGQDFYVSNDSHFFEAVNNRGRSDIMSKNFIYNLITNDYYILPGLKKPPAEMIEAQAPARLYRVWETTRSFWENCKAELIEENKVGSVEERLKLRGEFEHRDIDSRGLVQYHTYELKLDHVNLSIICVANGEYFTIDNLRRTANLLMQTNDYDHDNSQAAKDLLDYLSGKTFTVEEPTGYGSPNKPLGTLQITGVTIENTPYVPAIPILTEPRTFMALVPANKAMDVAKAIKVRYEEEMGKVRNRLPLTLGIVFAERRTPLPAILDAGRRMLKQSTESGTWKVESIDKSAWPDHVTLTLRKISPSQDQDQQSQDQDEKTPEQNRQTLTLEVPTIMGDEMTEDVWYPYWCLEKGAPNAPKRDRLFKEADGKDWVHIRDLYENDVVSFVSSRFDFEFLDTASRRFEVSYDGDKRRSTHRSSRPYYLEQLDELAELWEILSNGLATTQIDNLIHLIEAKRQEWATDLDNPTFKQMVLDIIKNAYWEEGKYPTPHIDLLCQAAINGQLADVADLYMSILKKRSVVDQQMGGK
jgi:CRISPR-associated Csx11 family protein